MTTDSIVVSLRDLSAAVQPFWRRLALDGDLQVVAGDDIEGRITFVDGLFTWQATRASQPIGPVERRRTCGSQELISNLLRAYKPASSGLKLGPTDAPKPDGFFVKQPDHRLSIKRRASLSIDFGDGREVACVANGFPFAAEGHLLALVSSRSGTEIEYPWVEQALTAETLRLALDLAAALGAKHAVGFNPVTGGASQDQFHLHIVGGDEFPIERALRIPLLGGVSSVLYPAGCLVLERPSLETLASVIDRLSQVGIVSNLLVRATTVFVFPRRPDVGVLAEFPSGMIAFSELSGRWIVTNTAVYEALDEDYLRTALRRATVPSDEAWCIAVR